MKKFLFAVLVAVLFVGQAFAGGEGWTVKGNAFGFKAGMYSANLNDQANGQVHLVALPTESLGFNFNFDKPSYGISGGYNLELTNVSAVNGSAHLSPIIGAGFQGSIDAGPYAQSQGTQPIQAYLGLDVNGPDLSVFSVAEIVPAATYNWNLQTGKQELWFGPIASFQGSFLDDIIVDIGRVF